MALNRRAGIARRREGRNLLQQGTKLGVSYWAATVGSVFEVAICAAMGTLEVASV